MKCLEKEVMALCRYIARRNTPPRIVALIPQEEEVDEQKVQIAPPGMGRDVAFPCSIGCSQHYICCVQRQPCAGTGRYY